MLGRRERQPLRPRDAEIISPDPEHSLGEERFVIFGVSHRCRLLAVMYSERHRLGDNAEVIRVISAREATRSERTAYEEGTR